MTKIGRMNQMPFGKSLDSLSIPSALSRSPDEVPPRGFRCCASALPRWLGGRARRLRSQSIPQKANLCTQKERRRNPALYHSLAPILPNLGGGVPGHELYGKPFGKLRQLSGQASKPSSRTLSQTVTRIGFAPGSGWGALRFSHLPETSPQSGQYPKRGHDGDGNDRRVVGP